MTSIDCSVYSIYTVFIGSLFGYSICETLQEKARTTYRGNTHVIKKGTLLIHNTYETLTTCIIIHFTYCLWVGGGKEQ